ncbi:GNAT family N-acetyltransferase [Novosphingobium sp. P6W]|nr:GNAT family N-acetyltransferase [Novosphingobium sp. P6W]
MSRGAPAAKRRPLAMHDLSPFLNPGSVAVVGGSDRLHSLGAAVLDNLIQGGFAGPIIAVNPHEVRRSGISWVARIEDLRAPPALAVVVTPPHTVPKVISALGAVGTTSVVILTAGLSEEDGLRQAMLAAASRHRVRIMGPNCLGLMAPHAKLNATFARTEALPGGLALISQSGALMTAVLDWAQMRSVGFSGLVSIGDMVDIDLGDLIDLFAADPKTKAILLYIEGVTDAAKFMSAAAAAARHKPVIAIKAGRSPAAAPATFSHTGALAGNYDVYRAAFERAGIVLVENLTELFDAAEIVCTSTAPRGARLGIVTNGGGAGILAVDALMQTDGVLASLDEDLLGRLNDILPAPWSGANPVDIRGDAGPDRYREATREVVRATCTDAVLIMNCPTGQQDAAAIAEAVAREVMDARATHIDKPVLACWLGEVNCLAASGIMARAGIAIYATPDDAIRGFGYLLASRQAREALSDRDATTRVVTRDVIAARRIVEDARADGRTELSQMEASDLLAAYSIPVAAWRFATATEDVEVACTWLKAPYVLKIVSRELVHKSEVGGVVTGLVDGVAACAAARAMEAQIRRERPSARLEGFLIQEQAHRPIAREMIVGIADDPTFGPVIVAGTGGTAVEIIADKALALPPIDHAQALALIGKTRMSRLLAAYRGKPAANIEAVANVLDALSAMAEDIPDILELDINPLLVDPDGVLALDARIRICAATAKSSRLVIYPAPIEWASTLVTQTGTSIYVRPVRADDTQLLAAFFERVSADDLRFRFLNGALHVNHEVISAMTNVDYRRTTTFLAFEEGQAEVIATAMLAADQEGLRAEVALATRSDAKGKGISWTLLEYVLRYAKARGIEIVEAIENAGHHEAIDMEREMGFAVSSDPADPTIRIVTRTFDPVIGD